MKMKSMQGQIKRYIQTITEIITKTAECLPACLFEYPYYSMECCICVSNNAIIVYLAA